MVRAQEIIDSTGTHLADGKHPSLQTLNIVCEFTLLNALAAHEQRHIILKDERALDQTGVEHITIAAYLQGTKTSNRKTANTTR